MVYLNLQIESIADGLIAAGYSLNSQVAEAIVAVSATQPTNSTAGQLWLNSANFALSLYNGVSWQAVGLSVEQTTTLATLAGNLYTKTEVDTAIAVVANSVSTKQNTLISGTSIKTINGVGLLGSGNVLITTPMGFLNDIQDTTIAAPISGQVLSYDGTKWVNTTTGVYEPANANLAKLNVAQTFTSAQRGGVSTITYAATITPDFSVANNFVCTLTGDVIVANPTNVVAGQYGKITLIQDATGSRTTAYGTYFKFAGGTSPTAVTTANAKTSYYYEVASETEIIISDITDWK
jgi:hypothetical protein